VLYKKKAVILLPLLEKKYIKMNTQ